MAECADDVDLLVLLPDGRSVAHNANANCPMMDLLVQIASKENLKPSAYTVEPLASSPDDGDYSKRQIIKYKPNTPIGILNAQVIRLAVKHNTGSSMPSAKAESSKADRKIKYSESFSNRVQNFNKMCGVSAVPMCNDPDGFTKLSEDTKKIKSRSNFITSTLPPQVSGNWNDTKQIMNTFRLQIHLPFEQLHVIRASPGYTIQDVLDIIRDERGLKLERYHILKTNEPDLALSPQGTLKEFGITELSLKLRPEFDVIRNHHINPKKIQKEKSSHFRSAFKSVFRQLKPSSRSNSVTELRHTSDRTVRPKSEIPRLCNTEFCKPRAPPRNRGQAPPPPARSGDRVGSALTISRSHTASESSCESTCDGSVGGSAPATLPRRCRLGAESASTINLAVEPPRPALRRGVSDMAVNKPKYSRRKRLAPKPPAPSAEELKEDGSEEQVTAQKTHESNEKPSSLRTNFVQYDLVDNSSLDCATKFPKHLDRIDDKKSENEVSCKSKGTVQNFSVPLEESDSEIELQHDQKVFQQKISNGQHLVAVNIDIDEPNDWNKDKVDVIQDIDLNTCCTLLQANSVQNTDEVINALPSTNTSFDKETFISELEVPRIDVQVEIHNHKNNVSSETEQTTDNEEDIELTNIPSASYTACYQNVESLPALDTPESKVLSACPHNVDSANSNRQSFTLSSFSVRENRSTKLIPRRSVSSAEYIASKPTVEELLMQMQKLKQKNTKLTQNHIQGYTPILQTNSNNEFQRKGFDKPEIVGQIEKQQTNERNYKSSTISSCDTASVNPVTENARSFHNNNDDAKCRLVTDKLTNLYSAEKQISEPVSARARPLPTFMLTSWAEEKKTPVVTRIADYGSKNSSTLRALTQTDVYMPNDKLKDHPLPYSLSATLPRPFTKPTDARTQNSTKLPTIINIMENSIQKQNDELPLVTNGRQCAYSKLNLFNISPTILPDDSSFYMDNRIKTNVPKASWELVQNASKKLLGNETNGQHVHSINETIHAYNNIANNNHTGRFRNERLHTESKMSQEARSIYKYAKPMQFQLGTWNDKAKAIQIETDVRLAKKNDPPLVKEIDEVAVWSSTY